MLTMSQPFITTRSQAQGTPQHVNQSCHLSESTSTTDSLNNSITLDASDDCLLDMDSTGLASQLQDTSSVQIEFISEFEEQLDPDNLSQTDAFLEPHDYDLFLMSQKIDTSSDNLSQLESNVCKKLCQDDPFFNKVTNLGWTFALHHFITEHNCEDLNPTDTPSMV